MGADQRLFHEELRTTLRARYRETLNDRRRAVGTCAACYAGAAGGLLPIAKFLMPAVSVGPYAAVTTGALTGIAVGTIRESALWLLNEPLTTPLYYVSSMGGITATLVALRTPIPDAIRLGMMAGVFATVMTMFTEMQTEKQKIAEFDHHHELGFKEGTVKGKDRKLYDMYLKAKDEAAMEAMQGGSGKPHLDEFRNAAGQVDYNEFYHALWSYYQAPFKFDMFGVVERAAEPSKFDPDKYLKEMDTTVDKYRKDR